MKPFSLGTVLNYRQRLEDIAKNGLAQAQQARLETAARLTEQQERYDLLLGTLETLQREGVNITELIRHEEHLQRVKEQRDLLTEELAQKTKNVVKAREQLLKRSKEKQVLEKLRERQNLAWRQHLEKKEAAILDEVAVIFHDRKTP